MTKESFPLKALAFILIVPLLSFIVIVAVLKVNPAVAPVPTGGKSQFQALPSPVPTKSLCPLPAIREEDYVWEGIIKYKDNKWLGISLGSSERVVVASYSAETVFAKVKDLNNGGGGLGECLAAEEIKLGDKITAYGVIKDKLFTASRVDVVENKENN